MKYSYHNFFAKLYRTQGRKFQFRAKDEEDFRIWKEAFTAALYKELGLDKLIAIEKEWMEESGKDPVRAIELESVQEEGYIRRKFVLETLPDVRMPFYMLVPDQEDKQARLKTMLTIPAHGANKNTLAGIWESEAEKEKINSTPDECYGLELVKQGYLVFCMDPPGYGERTEAMPLETKAFLPGREKGSLDSSCKDLSQTAEALGLSLTALEIWDLMKLADFACEREEVDQHHMGCAGFSGGGQYSMWLAALDERIRLAVISGYLHGYHDSILNYHLCPCNYAPNLWLLCDISDLCSLIAPRALFIENGVDDVENGPKGIAGPREQVCRICEAYELFGVPEMLQHATPEGGHKWYGCCYDFIREHL